MGVWTMYVRFVSITTNFAFLWGMLMIVCISMKENGQTEKTKKMSDFHISWNAEGPIDTKGRTKHHIIPQSEIRDWMMDLSTDHKNHLLNVTKKDYKDNRNEYHVSKNFTKHFNDTFRLHGFPESKKKDKKGNDVPVKGYFGFSKYFIFYFIWHPGFLFMQPEQPLESQTQRRDDPNDAFEKNFVCAFKNSDRNYRAYKNVYDEMIKKKNRDDKKLIDDMKVEILKHRKLSYGKEVEPKIEKREDVEGACGWFEEKNANNENGIMAQNGYYLFAPREGRENYAEYSKELEKLWKYEFEVGDEVKVKAEDRIEIQKDNPTLKNVAKIAVKEENNIFKIKYSNCTSEVEPSQLKYENGTSYKNCTQGEEVKLNRTFAINLSEMKPFTDSMKDLDFEVSVTIDDGFWKQLGKKETQRMWKCKIYFLECFLKIEGYKLKNPMDRSDSEILEKLVQSNKKKEKKGHKGDKESKKAQRAMKNPNTGVSTIPDDNERLL